MRTTTTSTTPGGHTPAATDVEPPHPPGTAHLLAGVRDLVPDVVGLTLCRTGPEGPVTLAASDPAVALLDALQHLDGGPAPVRDRDVALTADRWPHLARAAASAGVRAVRAVALHRDGVVVGEVHLYAATPDACAARADALAALLDDRALAAPVGATRDAGEEAPAAPRSLRADGAVHRAIGQLGVRLGTDPIAAHERLESAARRGGVDCEDLAAALVDLRP